MTPRPDFHPLQVEEIARVDIFPARSAENGRRIVAALRKIGFDIGPELEGDIIASKRASGRQKDRIELPPDRDSAVRRRYQVHGGRLDCLADGAASANLPTCAFFLASELNNA